jgi:hypothetical protein
MPISRRSRPRARLGDDIENAHVERLRRDRFGEEFGDAGVARDHDAFLVGMAGEHDDRHIRIGVGGLADHLCQFQAVKDRHHPIGDDDVGHEMGEGLEAGRTVIGFIDFPRAESVQQSAQDPPHMRAVFDDQKAQAVEVDTEHRIHRMADAICVSPGRRKRKETSLSSG